jgi:N-acetylglucosamine kinase-like BadF-type ATPase
VIDLDAAFKGGPGILQIAGTGSNTIGRAPDGRRECAGGYSSRLGDEGSGTGSGFTVCAGHSMPVTARS